MKVYCDFQDGGCSEILPWSKLEVQKDSPVAGIPTPDLPHARPSFVIRKTCTSPPKVSKYYFWNFYRALDSYFRLHYSVFSTNLSSDIFLPKVRNIIILYLSTVSLFFKHKNHRLYMENIANIERCPYIMTIYSKQPPITRKTT